MCIDGSKYMALLFSSSYVSISFFQWSIQSIRWRKEKNLDFFFKSKGNSCLKKLIFSIIKKYITCQKIERIPTPLSSRETLLSLPQQLKPRKILLTCPQQMRASLSQSILMRKTPGRVETVACYLIWSNKTIMEKCPYYSLPSSVQEWSWPCMVVRYLCCETEATFWFHNFL